MTSLHPDLHASIAAIAPVDDSFASAAWERLDSLTKPPRALGRLEHIAAHIACIRRTVTPTVSDKRIHVMAGDHGVVAQGVSPYPQDVTWQMAANVLAGGAGVNALAATVGATVEVFDVGIVRDVSHLPGIHPVKVAPGTADMSQGPAMTPEQCVAAVRIGFDAAVAAANSGCTLLGTGELGIGNTTAAAALASALLGVDPGLVVGRGTGVDDEGLARKTETIRRAHEVNEVEHLDAWGVLAAVGGLELAAMTGTVLGAACAGIPVVCDGFISTASALAAVRIAPACSGYLLPSHRSAEIGHSVVLEALGLEPIVEFDMRLGEGTGAALAFGIIDAACRMMSEMATFAEAGVSGSETA